MKRLSAMTIAAVAGSAALAAPSAADTIRLVNINGYTVLDREHLVLTGGAHHDYLVTLRSPCFGLTSGIEVGLSFPSTTTLTTPFMEYVYTGQDQQRCYIDTIEEVESTEAARALVAARAEADTDSGSR